MLQTAWVSFAEAGHYSRALNLAHLSAHWALIGQDMGTDWHSRDVSAEAER